MKKILLSVTPKIILIVAAIWVFCFLLLLGLGVKSERLTFAINVFEAVYGLSTSMYMIVLSRWSVNKLKRFGLLGIAFAIISWTIGQVFWLSYTSIMGEAIPYPSIGDMGYTGMYFFLIGVIGVLSSGQPTVMRKWYSYLSFLVILIPVLIIFIGNYKPTGYIYNFILSLAICFAFFKNFMLLDNLAYRWFVYGVFLIGITDIIFMISVCLFPDTHLFLSDMLYTISIALISYGMIKGGGSPHD